MHLFLNSQMYDEYGSVHIQGICRELVGYKILYYFNYGVLELKQKTPFLYIKDMVYHFVNKHYLHHETIW